MLSINDTSLLVLPSRRYDNISFSLLVKFTSISFEDSFSVFTSSFAVFSFFVLLELAILLLTILMKYQDK